MNHDDGLAGSASEDPAQPALAPSIDARDVLRNVARARALQSEAMASLAGAAWRFAHRGIAGAVRAIARRHAGRATRRALYDLSDHLLADIGITRDAIPAVVDRLLDGIDPRASSAELRLHRVGAHAAGRRAGDGDRRDLAA